MDLKDLLQLAGLTNNAHAHSEDSLDHDSSETMRKLVVMIDPEQLNMMKPSSDCGCGSDMEEETVEEWANSGDHVSGEPEQMTTGHGELGAAVDTSLRRYLDASGANVKVDEGFKIRDKSRGYGVSDETYKTHEEAKKAALEKMATTGSEWEVIKEQTVYPDHSVEDISEAYAAFKEGNYKSDAQRKAVHAAKAEESIEDQINEGDMMSAADELEAYARENGGIDAKDFMTVVDMMRKGEHFKLNKFVYELDTEPREKILSIVDKHLAEEAAKPDYIDIDGDGDKEESMKKAAKDKKAAEVDESINILKTLAGL